VRVNIINPYHVQNGLRRFRFDGPILGEYQDARALKDTGGAAVYTPKDFALNRIMANLMRIVEDAADRGQ
jgi:hypothetical protein